MRTVYTVGHSTRSVDEFVALLREHGIELVADVRTVPRSRHNPQYDTAAMREWLPEHGIAYEHLERLGGFRRPVEGSPNTAWRNAAFRGYADYMLTPGFEAALGELVRLAGERTTAVMCAEAVPWRCHRSLIADALVARGIEAVEIMGPGQARPHLLTRFARVEDGLVTYPGEEGEPPEART